MSLLLFAQLLAWALLGPLIGYGHFASLRWMASRLLAGDGPGWGLLLALQVLRIAVLLGAGLLAVRQGALPLLALAAGVLLARAALLARTRRAATAEGESAA